MTNKEMKQRFTQLYRNFAITYQEAADNSRAVLLKSLKPGESAPPIGKILNSAGIEEFNNTALQYRQKAREILNDWSKGMAAERTKVNPEAAATISLLAMRTDLKPDDLYDALETYGGDYSSYAALMNLARQKDLHINDPGHPLKGTQEVYHELTAKVDQLFTRVNAELHYGKQWYQEAVAQDLDGLIPDD